MMAIQSEIQPVGSAMLRFFAVCLACLLFTGCADEPGEDIMNRLYGGWETGAAGYEAARFEIRKGKIVFYAVDGTVSVNSITGIQHSPDKEGGLLSIEYEDHRGQEYLLKFYLYSKPDGDTLVFKNQAHIAWKKPRVLSTE